MNKERIAKIDVWVANIESFLNYIDFYRQLLSYDEETKASFFLRKEDEVKYIISHGILRCILSKYIHKHPKDLIFHTNAYGKPYTLEILNLDFNISHSRNILIIGIARNAYVGVDVEFKDSNFVTASVLAQFLSESEKKQFTFLPEKTHIDVFYRAWVCKEAFIKALGVGMHLDPKRICSEINPNKPPSILKIDQTVFDVPSWTFSYGLLDHNYAFSIASSNKKDNYFLYRYNSSFIEQSLG